MLSYTCTHIRETLVPEYTDTNKYIYFITLQKIISKHVKYESDIADQLGFCNHNREKVDKYQLWGKYNSKQFFFENFERLPLPLYSYVLLMIK
jgi:hypothetical protein